MNGLGLGQRRKLGRRVRRTLDLVLSVGLVALMISGAAVRVSAGVTAVTLDGPGIYGEDYDRVGQSPGYGRCG